MYVKIALPVPLRKAFDYHCGASTNLPRGARVRVPFGSRNLVGVVLGHSETPEFDRSKIRPVSKIIDHEPILPENLLSLLEWTAGYYHHPVGETIFTALPTLVRQTRSVHGEPAACWVLTAAGRALQDNSVKGKVQQRLLALFRQNDDPVSETSLRAISASARQSLQRMAHKGWVEPVECPPETTPVKPADTTANVDRHRLNADQDAAVSAINAASGFASFVLHGVTGSGKTEVYIRTARNMLEQGRQVLILTPEIGLTPQLTGRLEYSLGVTASVLHSGLNDSERLQAWRHAREGRSRLIIGTRSSIFTPAPELGMIIVDEEHDLSYKQQDGLRYNARDVALMRARREGIPIVLGSATPSLESWANCEAGRHQLLSLPQRAGNAQPPAMQFLDMRKTPSLDGLSPQLLDAIREQVGKGEQTLLFLNRRGYSPVL
ncbi:MAG: primosomal protein N', partial [Gammaproteobacteria bacterium]